MRTKAVIMQANDCDETETCNNGHNGIDGDTNGANESTQRKLRQTMR